MPDPIHRLNAALEGRYRIERELGEGGMATVYLADDLRHERKVALKVLRPELAAVVGAERFLGEIKTTASLQHPHILPLHDSGDADGFLFYVMPYVEGETLRERMNRERQLPVDEAVRIASNVAEALDYAHARGVIHRDVKPANVLLQAGKPVISDFGIALAVSAGGAERLTETGLSLGTPHYMSPEQATGDQGVGPPSDIYALGCVLYEMLLGEPPYQGGTAQAILGKIITATPDRVTERRPSVPANVDAAIRRALEKVPADRFGRAVDFARALGDAGFSHGVEVAVRVGAGAARLWNPLSITLGIVSLALAAGFGWALFSGEASAPPAVIRSTFALPEGDRLSEGDRNAAALAVSPDGQDVVYIGSRDGTDLLYHRPFGSDEARPLPGTEGALSPFFSPDGRWVGFFAGGELKKVLLAGGLPVPIAPGVQMHGASWGADDVIYFGEHASSIWRVPASGGTPEPVTIFEPGGAVIDHTNPDLLPGGRAVLFTMWTQSDETSRLAVKILDTGEERELLAGSKAKYVPTGHLVFSRQQALWAVRFDLERLEIIGEPYSMLEDLWETSGGRHFAFASNGTLVYARPPPRATPRLVSVDSVGNARELSTAAEYHFPRVSPDGTRVAVAIGNGAEADLWAIDLDRPTRTRLTFGGTNQLFPYTWTPDSRQVTFSEQVDNRILNVVADGSGVPRLLLTGLYGQWPASWSPDGETLAFYMNHPETQRDLWTWSAADSTTVAFLLSAFNERAPRFSPDGRWIAYVSNESGADEVYAQAFPGPGGRVTVSTGGGTEPAWSAGGDALYYRDGSAMMVVDVVTEPTLRLGTPRVQFVDERYALDGNGNPNYDVLPDGTGFVMVLGRGAPTELQVVQNWFQELVERAPE